MAFQFASLNPNDVIVTFKAHEVQHFATGTHIEVEYDEDLTAETPTCDGSVVRMINNNEMGTVTFTISQASPSNDALSSFANADRKSRTGVGTLSITDLAGTSLYTAQHAWVKKHAKDERSNEATNRVWAIKVAKLKAHVGGSVR